MHFQNSKPSKNMWEHVLLRHFRFRKNLSKPDQEVISQVLAKKRRLGRKTYAIDLCGVQIPERRTKRTGPNLMAFRGGSPKLPRDVLIRTPPPGKPVASRELQRRVNLSYLPGASSSAIAIIEDMVPDWILDVRSSSPFNQTLLRLPLYLESSIVTDNDVRNYFMSLSQMYQMRPSPSLFGTSSSLEILSYACFSMSQGNYSSNFTDRRPLLNWVGKVADLHFLNSIFALNTATLLEFWWKLLQTSTTLQNVEAVESLIRVGVKVANGQWARYCLQVYSDYSAEYDSYLRVYRDLPQSLHNLMRTSIQTGTFDNVDSRSWTSLFSGASSRHDIDMLKMLAGLGHHISELFPMAQQDLLWRVGSHEGPKRDLCFQYLLNSGVEIVPALEDEAYWSGPDQPRLARDRAWKQSRYDSSFLEYFYQYSTQGEGTVTVSGVCRAAAGGRESLQHYLDATPHPGPEGKAKLLETSLSESAGRDYHDIVCCLLDYGVDPDVPSLPREIHRDSPLWVERDGTWNPTVRAINRGYLETAKRLLDQQDSRQNHDIFITVINQDIPNIDGIIESLWALGLSPPGPRDEVAFQISLKYSQSEERQLEGLHDAISQHSTSFASMDLLHMALQGRPYLKTIEYLLDSGQLVHSIPSTRSGSTMLVDALVSRSSDRAKIVDLLLERGAHPALGDAQALLEAPFRSDYCSPGFTSHDCNEDLVLFRLMLERGALWPVNTENCQTNLVTLLIRTGADDSFVFEALDAGQDLNLQGAYDSITPLMESIFRERYDLARTLILRGADVNTMASPDGEKGEHRRELLYFGAEVNGGFEVSAPTSLHLAALAGHLNIVSLLIGYGADANATVRIDDSSEADKLPRGEWSPLDRAAWEGNLEMVHLLYGVGSRSGSRVYTEVDGAVQLARKRNQLGVLRFFEERIDGLEMIPDLL
ncbi:uncharacterized protein PG998_006417 [Apiospora kogelbergensis]|uniref:uncharacterized protein n=1 Tax=Apiospora kogelbergensis TaxID=1337665 RepID=UPI00312E2B6C